ncbi:hypothetical protein BH23GEM6_BH23GEM6_24870 [soil metagenome]
MSKRFETGVIAPTEMSSSGGELRERWRDFQWESTPWGPDDGWPARLKPVANLVMVSPSDMLLAWRGELVQIFNDGHAGICGREHRKLVHAVHSGGIEDGVLDASAMPRRHRFSWKAERAEACWSLSPSGEPREQI